MNHYACTVINGKHTVKFFVEGDTIKQAYQEATIEAKEVFPVADENVISIEVEEVTLILKNKNKKKSQKCI